MTELFLKGNDNIVRNQSLQWKYYPKSFHTFFKMPQIKVVRDVLQNILHTCMTCNLNMSIRYKCLDDHSTSNEKNSCMSGTPEIPLQDCFLPDFSAN